MKFDKFLSVACAAVLLSSCNNESLEIAQNQNEPSQESVEVTIGDEVKGYAESLETLTGLLYTAGKQSDFEKFLNYNLPEIGALGKLDIKDATGAPIKFADLPENEQKLFIHHIALYMAKVQIDKATKTPQLNQVYYTVRNAINAIANLLNKITKNGLSFEEIDKYLSKASSTDLFVQNLMSEYLTKADTRLFAGFGPLTGSTFTFDYYKEKVADKAKKGDLCVILPIHGEPYNLMNIPEIVLGLTLGIGDLDHRSWGHSGMFTRDVTKDMQYDNKEVVDSIMFGAIIEGVHYETIDNWLTESYILEIKKLEYTWNPASNNPLTVNRSEYSQQERDKFIEIATSYEGTIFVESYTDDFLTGYLFIKDVIPDTFHCSGLIWWTALQAYGIDLSIPFLRTVSPSRLILNPYTDIKVVLE